MVIITHDRPIDIVKISGTLNADGFMEIND